jgi:phosphate transport system permease protein
MSDKEQALRKRKKLVSGLGNTVILACVSLIVLLIIVITIDVFAGGASALSWEFLTELPRDRMTQGGILPCIVGTFYVTIITTIFSIPFGVATAIYLNEYARDNRTTRLIRLAIRNLSGVPSIVYGMFGVALFVDMFGFGTSILSAGLTLGLLTIPWTITASEEALKAVPVSFREGSLALGATKWYTIRKNVLPYAIPGIITGGILGLARAAGETAPILFTGAAFSLPAMPGSVFDQFMALPYHIYILATQHEKIEQVRPLAYGTALVLIALVFLLSLFAIILRSRIRRRGIVNY